MKKFSRNNSNKTPKPKRLRLCPPRLSNASASSMPPSLPPFPPPKNNSKPPASLAPVAALSNSHKMAEMRSKYLDDTTMVIQELKAVLTYGPGSACPDSPVPPSVVLKLVRTVQTLEKLRSLLLMNPTRLRRVSLAQVETIEQQIKMNLLPIATLFRSFDNKRRAAKAQDGASTFNDSVCEMEQGRSQHRDAKSPRSPSGVSVTSTPQYDWRFLSMALSLQL